MCEPHTIVDSSSTTDIYLFQSYFKNCSSVLEVNLKLKTVSGIVIYYPKRARGNGELLFCYFDKSKRIKMRKACFRQESL